MKKRRESVVLGSYAHTIRLARYRDSEIVFREGDASDAAYEIVDGEIALRKQSENGAIDLARIGPGQIFGEMGLFDNSPRSATAVSVGVTRLNRVPREAFLERVEDDPEFAKIVFARLADRLRATNTRLTDSQVDSLRQARATSAAALAERERGFMGRLRRLFLVDPDIIAFQPDAEEIVRRPAPPIARIAFYAMTAVMLVALIASMLIRVDTFVSAPGRLVTTEPRIVLQPIETGRIQEILVRPGDRVAAGDRLVALDASVATAQVTASRSTLASVEAELARREASFAGETLAAPADATAMTRLQAAISGRRATEDEARLAVFAAEAEALDQRIAKTEAAIAAAGAEVEVLSQLERIRADLFERRFGSRSDMLAARNERLGMEQQRDQLTGELNALREQAGAVAAERASYLNERRSTLGDRIGALRRERDELTERLRMRERQSSLVELVAPREGIVLEVGATNVGAVALAGEPLVTIVPTDGPLEAELEIAPKDVGQLSPGATVRIRLDTISFDDTGGYGATLRVIAEDTVEIGAGAQRRPVYRARAELVGPLEPALWADAVELTPGMTLEGDIRTGERRLITYFIYPVLRGFD